MNNILGIRREDKNKWEKRVPITPEHLREMKNNHNIESIVQKSPIRVFTDKEYEKKGIKVRDDLNICPVIFGVKEMPLSFFEENKTYVFFSHIIKGQKYNMPMLKEMIDKKCSLIDYEKITDEKGRRLVFFGRYAGLAGMTDTLWAFGQKLDIKGIKTPFSDIKQTIKYDNLEKLKKHLLTIAEKIEKKGLNEKITPLVVGFTGYGNVSKGAQEIIDCLPIREIRPSQLEEIEDNYENNLVYKVVFKENDIVEPIDDEEFDLEKYYHNPELFRPIFTKYIPHISILMNCIYWDERYPKLITKKYLKKQYFDEMKLQIVGDISVDVGGAIEFTEKVTSPDQPVFIYNPNKNSISDGVKGDGIAVMAVDNLPCELPRESSEVFSDSLLPFIPYIVKADYNKSYDKIDLPDKIKKALILHKGKLTPDYEYINKFL